MVKETLQLRNISYRSFYLVLQIVMKNTVAYVYYRRGNFHTDNSDLPLNVSSGVLISHQVYFLSVFNCSADNVLHL
jgi:hypothetical protein